MSNRSSYSPRLICTAFPRLPRPNHLLQSIFLFSFFAFSLLLVLFLSSLHLATSLFLLFSTDFFFLRLKVTFFFCGFACTSVSECGRFFSGSGKSSSTCMAASTTFSSTSVLGLIICSTGRTDNPPKCPKWNGLSVPPVERIIRSTLTVSTSVICLLERIIRSTGGTDNPFHFGHYCLSSGRG